MSAGSGRDGRLEELVEELNGELGLDLDFEALSDSGSGSGSVSGGSGFESVEREVVVPFDVGDDEEVRNEKVSRMEDGVQVKEIRKYRPRCPSCGHVVSDPDEPNQLQGRCWECGVQTCPSCREDCESCGRICCPDHVDGHGAKDEAYCRIHREDAEREVSIDYELDRRESRRLERKDELEHVRQEDKLEWREEKEGRELVKSEWEKYLDILEKIEDVESVSTRLGMEGESSEVEEHPLYRKRRKYFNNTEV